MKHYLYIRGLPACVHSIVEPAGQLAGHAADGRPVQLASRVAFPTTSHLASQPASQSAGWPAPQGGNNNNKSV